MGKLRIAWLKMLIALRLATMLSLALLPFSMSPAMAHEGSHEMHQASTGLEHGDGRHHIDAHCAPAADASSATPGTDSGKNSIKQYCCTAFCVGLAVLTETDMPHGRLTAPLRGLAPDHQVSPGAVPNLKRPPKA